MFKANFNFIGLMLDFPNMKDCDIAEWEAIVDLYILSNKSKNKKAGLIASLSETLPKHIRDKCLKSGIVPLQGLKEALFAIHCSISTGKAWSDFNVLKNIKKGVFSGETLKDLFNKDDMNNLNFAKAKTENEVKRENFIVGFLSSIRQKMEAKRK